MSKITQKFNVLLPKIKEDGSAVVWKPLEDKEHLIPMFKNKSLENMIHLINKPPTWSEELNAYVSSFNGKQILPSDKNVQLVNPSDGLLFLYIR